jgi:DNA-directed RNA polymerase subunit RPC12/RpoP
MKAQKPLKVSRYLVGQKRCQTCSVYIEWEGVWCPCCSYRLRTKPRAKQFKEKLKRIEAYRIYV